MPRPAPDPQTVQKALVLLSEGVSLREAARRCGVSPSTLYTWKTDATKPARSETKPETKPNATGKANAPKQAPRRAATSTVGTPPPADLSALLAEKDERIALLTSHVDTLTTELSRWQAQTDKLTDALTEERRRNDVLQLQASQRPALPSPDVTSNRRELWVFIAAVSALVLLSLALLLSR